MSVATKNKPKPKAKAPKPAAAEQSPKTADELRAALAAAEKKFEGMFKYHDGKKYDALEADIKRMREDLALAEVRELPAPAEIVTDYQERNIAIDTIEITGNHREQHDQAALERLAASLKGHSLQQRIGVRSMGNNRHELIFGSRRLGAAKINVWKEIPAKVYAADLTAAQVEILRSIENFGRKNLTSVEEAMAVARVVDAINLTVEPLRKAGFEIDFDAPMLSVDFGAATESDRRWQLNEKVTIAAVESWKPELSPACRLFSQIVVAGGLDAYVGQQFSRPARWVADHAYVSKLGGSARELLMTGRIDIGHARELAKLGDKARADSIAAMVARDEQGLGGKTVEQCRRWVHESLRSLKVVPWRLDVAFGQGFPGCTGHACVTCPFNSKTDPDLFGGSITDEPEAGVCTNGACFQAKGKIIDQEMQKTVKKAAPVVKKEVSANSDGAGAITMTSVGHLLPTMMKPASGVRRLQKDLGHMLPAKAGEKAKPAAGGKHAEPAQSPEDKAKQIYQQAMRDYVDAMQEAFFVAAHDDANPLRLPALLMLDVTKFASTIQRWEWSPPTDKVGDATLKDGEELIAAISDASVESLKTLGKQLNEDDVGDCTGNIGSVFMKLIAPRVLKAWGVDKLPVEPKLEDFLPKPKPAKKGVLPPGGSDGDDFDSDDPIFNAEDVGLTLSAIEKADAIEQIKTTTRTPYAKIKSVQYDGDWWVVLGTTKVRGHECWRLAVLGKSQKDDLGDDDAAAAAGREEFDGIGIIDTSDGEKRKRIVATPGQKPAKVIYVRVTA